MGAAQTAEPSVRNTATFESVWAALDRLAECQKETERVMKEDTQRFKESLNEKIGALTNLFGDVTEAMVAPKICEKFEEFGFNFPRANQNVRINDRVNKIPIIRKSYKQGEFGGRGGNSV